MRNSFVKHLVRITLFYKNTLPSHLFYGIYYGPKSVLLLQCLDALTGVIYNIL